jgi:hypothetical protein
LVGKPAKEAGEIEKVEAEPQLNHRLETVNNEKLKINNYWVETLP